MKRELRESELLILNEMKMETEELNQLYIEAYIEYYFTGGISSSLDGKSSKRAITFNNTIHTELAQAKYERSEFVKFLQQLYRGVEFFEKYFYTKPEVYYQFLAELNFSGKQKKFYQKYLKRALKIFDIEGNGSGNHNQVLSTATDKLIDDDQNGINLIKNFSSPSKSERISRVDEFRNILNEYNFFELPKIKEIGNNIEIVMLKICDNDAPFQIALFDHVGFLLYLKKEIEPNLEKRKTILSKLTNVSRETAYKNLLTLNVLANHTEEFKKRYTAHTYLKTIEQMFTKLKK